MTDRKNTAGAPVEKVSEKNKFLKVAQLCAVAFAVVSFNATAEGLGAFFGVGWPAYFVSFAVQGLMLLVALKGAPAILGVEKTGRGTKNQRLKRGLLIVIYLLLMTVSSLFCFVHLATGNGRYTRFTDSTYVIERGYYDTLHEVNEYLRVREGITERDMSLVLAALQDNMEVEVGADTVTDLTVQLKEAETDLETAEANHKAVTASLVSARESYRLAQETLRAAQSGQWLANRDEIIETAQRDVDELKQKVDDLEEAEKQAADVISALKTKKTDLETRLGNGQLIFGGEVYTLLAELMKDAPDVALLNGSVEQIFDVVLGNSSGAYKDDSFVRTVGLIQEFRRQVVEYTALREAHVYVEDALGALELITVPSGVTSTETEIAAWRAAWNGRLNELSTAIRAIPAYVLAVDEQNEVAVALAEVELGAYADTLDALKRNHVGDLADMERAFRTLVGKYPFQALAAMVIAILLDSLALVAGLLTYIWGKGEVGNTMPFIKGAGVKVPAAQSNVVPAP